MILSAVTIESLPFPERGGCRMSMVVFSGSSPVFDHGKAHGWLQMFAEGGELEKHLCSFTLDLGAGGVCLSGDICIRFYAFEDDCGQIAGCTGLVHPGALRIDYGGVRGKCVCFLSFNTAMIGAHDAVGRAPAGDAVSEVIRFSRSEVDGAHADTAGVKFLSSFSISVALTRPRDIEEVSVREQVCGYGCACRRVSACACVCTWQFLSSSP